VLHLDVPHPLQLGERATVVRCEDGGVAWREASMEEDADSAAKGKDVVLDKR
jgi:hypothetical protein